jgi:hypothetical protein
MLPFLLFLQAAPQTAPQNRATFEAAFRTGLSIPVGFIESNLPVQEIAGLQVPVMLEMGARTSPRVFVGGYAAVGIGSTSRRFDQDFCNARDCAARTVRIGGELHLHIRPAEVVDPWVGAGIGYEWFFTSGTPKVHMSGVEAIRPMIGVDLRMSKSAALGFFLDAPLSVYTTYEPPVAELDRATDKRIHSWVTFGIRLVLSRAPGS